MFDAVNGILMAKRFLFPDFLYMVLLSSCGPSIRLYSDTNAAAMFDQYKTYNFLDFSEGNKKSITGMELEQIRIAFARELESRGLSYANEDADVSVQIIIYHREAVRRYAYTGRYHHLERAIAFDMYDNQSRQHVWHCAAIGELEYDPEQRAAELPLLVAKMFERYPVRPEESI
jgi:hypothetical protein